MTITFAFDPNPYPYKFNDFRTFDSLNDYTRIQLQYYLYSCGNNCDSTIIQSIPKSDTNIEYFFDPYNQINISRRVDVPFFELVNETNA